MTKIEKLEKRMKDFKENTRKVFDEFTDMHLNTQRIQVGAKNADATKSHYSSVLLKDVESHLVKLTKMTKILQAALTETPKEEEIPKLLAACEGFRSDHEKIQSWALRFGLADAAKPKRRRKS